MTTTLPCTPPRTLRCRLLVGAAALGLLAMLGLLDTPSSATAVTGYGQVRFVADDTDDQQQLQQQLQSEQQAEQQNEEAEQQFEQGMQEAQQAEQQANSP